MARGFAGYGDGEAAGRIVSALLQADRRMTCSHANRPT